MVSINQNYIRFPEWGVLRIILILALLAGWIAAAASGDTASVRDAFGVAEPFGTKIAYLVIAIIAFCLSIAIFFLNLFDLPSNSDFPYLLIFAGVDALFAIGLLGVSIAAAVSEAKVAQGPQTLPIGVVINGITVTSSLSVYDYYNKASLGVAAAFGFVAFLIYIAIIVLEIIEWLQDKDEEEY